MTPDEARRLVEEHGDDPTVRSMDLELDGAILVAERILTLHGVTDPTEADVEALTDAVLEAWEAGDLADTPDHARRVEVQERARELLGRKPPTVH